MSGVYQDFVYGPLETFPGVTSPMPSLSARRFAGPLASWEYFQDHYATFTNLALIGRAEDYNLGWDTRAQFGYFASSSAAADRPGSIT